MRFRHVALRTNSRKAPIVELELRARGTERIENLIYWFDRQSLALRMIGLLLWCSGVMVILLPAIFIGSTLVAGSDSITFLLGAATVLSGGLLYLTAIISGPILRSAALRPSILQRIGFQSTRAGGLHPSATNAERWYGKRCRIWLRDQQLSIEELKLFESMTDEWSGSAEQLARFIKAIR
jgi:hypothetical protein